MNILENMNEKQKEAVKTTEGPVLIMAGAGSRTKSLLANRISYLINEKQINPWNILTITSSNKSAREVKEYVYSLNPSSKDSFIGTFHSICIRILRRNADKINYSPYFTIINSNEQHILMNRVLKFLNLDTEKWNHNKILTIISNSKKNLLNDIEYENSYIQGIKKPTLLEETSVKCYKLYQEILRQSESMDLDDLILQTIRLFEDKKILTYYQNLYQYIHVDEYQDTTRAQYQLIKLLSSRSKNICVVGDTDQYISNGKGSDLKNILEFEKDYPNSKLILLEENYHSTKIILQAANDIIQNNQKRYPKNLWTNNEEGVSIVYCRKSNEKEEALYVSKIISELYKTENYSYKDFAIFYRVSAQSRTIEESLIQSDIPYKISVNAFYSRKEIKDIIAYLKFIVNPKDHVSFERIINKPNRYIGQRTLQKIYKEAHIQNLSLLEVSTSISDKINENDSESVYNFSKLMCNVRNRIDYYSLTELVEEILKQTRYEEYILHQETLESQERVENIREFLSVTKNFDEKHAENIRDSGLDRLTCFLNDISFMEDSDGREGNGPSGVILRKISEAQGLEVPIVFIVGMEESVFPLHRALEEGEIEEERRLAYVGFTCAEKQLYLTNATERLLFGKKSSNRPSRFLNEISVDVLDFQGKACPV